MIDTEALRKKVIDLALQGKLTQQLPEDGNAEDLYAQIQEERAKLVKEGKIKKEKPLSEIKENDILFEIPSSWMYLKLGNIALPLSDGVHYAPEYQTEGYKCFSAKDIYSNSINDSECTYITEEEYLGMKDKINIRKGSILITKSGSIGRSAIVNECFEFGLVESIGVINTILVIPEYVKCVLDYGFVYSTKYFEKFTRGVGLKHLTLSLLENIPIPVPPIDEQKRIVERIEQLFTQIDIIDTLQQQYAHNLEVLKGKIIDAGIRGRLTEQLPEDGNADDLYAQIQEEKEKLIKEGKIKKEKPLPEISDDEIPFEIPNTWKWVYLGDIFNHNTGKALNSADKEGEQLEYITTSNMYWDHFELDNLKKMFFKESEIEKCTIRKGDLLICEGGDIGRSAIWEYDYEMRIQNHIHKLRGYGAIDHKFYFYIMRNYKERGIIDGRGIGLQGFSSKRVHSLVVPLPPLKEQKRIVTKIETVLNYII